MNNKIINLSISSFEEVVLRAKTQLVWEEIISDLFKTGIVGLIQDKELLKKIKDLHKQSQEFIKGN